MSIQLNNEEVRNFENLEFLAKQVVAGFITGLHKSPFHGFSVEFSEHRLYNKGESIRNIDWKLFGRTERLYVKRFEEETNLRCQLVIDTSSSMYYPDLQNNKYAFSALAAASIMNLLKSQRDAVGLSLFDENLKELLPQKSNFAHQKLVISKLEEYLKPKKAEQGTSTAKVLHEIAEAVKKRSLIIIFSDLFENIEDKNELFQALQHLKYNKNEVIIFHTVDEKHEIDFEFTNRPHLFVDMETGEKLKLNPFTVKEEYKSKLADFKQELKHKTQQFGIDLIEADINKGFKQVLLPYLIKRQKLL